MEEWKLLWEEHESGQLDSREVDQKMLRGIIHSRSRSAIARIRRNIWLEILAILFPLWIFVSYTLYQETSGLQVWLPIGVPAVFSLVFYGIKLFSLNQNPLEDANLLQSLRKKVWLMGRYLRIYNLLGSVLIPLLAGASIVWGFVYAALEKGRPLEQISWSSWALVGGTILLFASLSHLFFKWYIGKLYQGHYEELLACLHELEEKGSS